MTSGDIISVLSAGLFASSGGGTCDYPAVGDVRSGVAYGGGSYTGNLTLPAVGNVRRGVKYGTLGTQYTGTFVCPGGGGGGSGASLYSNQSVKVEEVLDAIQSLLVAATGFDARSVLEWHFDQRPNVDTGKSVVWFRHVRRTPDVQSGAGRHGSKSDLLVEVNLTSRQFLDSNQRDRRLIRRQLETQFLIENAFYGQELFDSYLSAIGEEPPQPARRAAISPAEAQGRRANLPGAVLYKLSVGTMTAAELPAPTRPRPEQGYVETRIGVSIPVVLRLTINSHPELET